MKWNKLKTHLTHWANELEDYGNFAEARYVRDELIPKLDVDLPIYNERGKQKILELIKTYDGEN